MLYKIKHLPRTFIFLRLMAMFKIDLMTIFPEKAKAKTLILIILIGFMGMMSCGTEPEDVPLDDINIDLNIIRLDEAMYDASVTIQEDSTVSSSVLFDRFFAPSKGFVTDWIFYGNDSLASDLMVGQFFHEFVSNPMGQVLLDTMHQTLGGVDLKGMLEKPLKRYKYFFPDRKMPQIVAFADGFPPTAQAGLDQIYISPNYLGIGMHYFMGPKLRYYPEDLPKYIRRRCTPAHIPSLMVHKMAEIRIKPPELSKNPVLIDYVVNAGMKMYFVDKLLGPNVHDTLKIFYDATQMDWASHYEARIYKDLVNDLYSADAQLQRRFIEDSPFTSQLNRGSAPRLGQYIGWKIVNEYMKRHPDETLDGLVKRKDFQKIFKDSGYRPAKGTE